MSNEPQERVSDAIPLACPECGSAALYACMETYEHYDITRAEDGSLKLTRVAEDQHDEGEAQIGCRDCDYRSAEPVSLPREVEFYD